MSNGQHAFAQGGGKTNKAFLSFAKTVYYFGAFLAFSVLVNDVLFLRWHSWDRHLLGWIPFGEITGWLEILLFGSMGFASVYYAFREMRRFRQSPPPPKV